MKVAVAEAVSTKNNLSRNGGFHPRNGYSGSCHAGPVTNLMSRNSPIWVPCKDNSNQAPRSPDAQNLELRPVELSFAKTVADELHELN